MAVPSKDLASMDPEELFLLQQIIPARMPRHIAVIMDGNGRWAEERHLPRVKGHEAGLKTVREIVEYSGEIGLEVLTLYTFSVENWKRPRQEVSALMRLLKIYIRKEGDNLVRNNVRFVPIGRYREFAPSLVKELEALRERTSKNTGLIVNAALNYGGRAEIVDACKRLMQSALSGSIRPEELDEKDVEQCTYTAGLPDPDLLIRTGGELRISNFLLWQAAYSELWFTSTYWPDFKKKDLLRAILDYQKRDRRYGGVK